VLHQLRDGIDDAGDELAFQDHDIGRVAFQSGEQIGERLGLRHHTDVVLQSEDLLHAHAVDGLGVGQNDTDSGGRAGLLMGDAGGRVRFAVDGLGMAAVGGRVRAVVRGLCRIDS